MKVINYDPEHISDITAIAEIKCISEKEKNHKLMKNVLSIIVAVGIMSFLIKSNKNFAFIFMVISVFTVLFKAIRREEIILNEDSLKCLSKRTGINIAAIRYHQIVTENNISKAELHPLDGGKAVLHLYKEDGGLMVASDEITFTCVMGKGISEEVLDIGNGMIYMPLTADKDDDTLKEKENEGQ